MTFGQGIARPRYSSNMTFGQAVGGRQGTRDDMTFGQAVTGTLFFEHDLRAGHRARGQAVTRAR
ncbi:hypothetical protein [Enhygromyxa salina]|uniref:hypothetical protein n=1 Tax=Enhygromyxa salina TaxID=215803 RepID=UPI000D08FC7D|nr:hypothetical protein [Enhygromyxa salina]